MRMMLPVKTKMEKKRLTLQKLRYVIKLQPYTTWLMLVVAE
jgi:hypothetical protein